MAKFTDEQLKDCMSQNMTTKKIADKFGVHPSNVRKRKAKLVKRGFSPEHGMNQEVPEGYLVKGVSSLYDADGNVKMQWVKSGVDPKRQLEMLEEGLKAFAEDLPKLKKRKAPKALNKDLLAVYPLGDPHIGMHAWGEECGADWDLKIAEQTYAEIFDRVIKSTPKCETAVIANLGDFFHYDNMEGTTTRSGNILEIDSRYPKMIRVGVMIIRRMIESALDHHGKVKVINTIGNHDDTGAVFLSICLQHIYENEPRVEVDISPSVFKYVRFGKVLLGVHHGHSTKMDKLPSVMAANRSKDWGETKFRHWLTGHIHHDSKKEYPGCTAESFRTVAAADAYAVEHGYKSHRDTKSLVFHKEYGEIERHTINISQINK